MTTAFLEKTDRVSNPGPLAYGSGALPIALRGPARISIRINEYVCSAEE